MTSAVSRAEASAAQRAVEQARTSSVAAERNTRGPVWWAASKLPWVGDDVTAVRTVAEVSRDLTAGALRDLVAAGADFSGNALQPKDRRVQLEPIRRLVPALDRGSDELGDASARVDRLSTGGLLTPVQGPVIDLQDKLARAATASSDAAAAARLLPGMLGAEGERTYLLLFQNNAETRSLGGFGGAFAVVKAKEGRLTLTRTSGPGEIGYLDKPFGQTSAEESALFGDDIVRYSQNTVTVPDFPRASELLAQMWEGSQGQQIDGVISFDPVALSHLLRATGPVTVEGRRLTPANVVDVLLRDTYLELPNNKVQNEFFASTTRTVFERIAQGQFSPTVFAQALKQSVDERRLLAYSADEAEQAQLAAASIGGALPQADGARPDVGVYLNDSSSDKLTYYLRYRTDVTADRCYLGAQRLHVRTVLRSKVPPGKFNKFVVGIGRPGLPLGDMRITTYTYGPVGGRIDSVTVDGRELPVNSKPHLGRPVGAVTVDIPRGATRVIEYDVYSARGQSGQARLLTTPGAKTDGLGVVGPSAC